MELMLGVRRDGHAPVTNDYYDELEVVPGGSMMCLLRSSDSLDFLAA